MDLARQRVLIIHDNVEEIEVLRTVLEHMGFDPEIALEPQMAREILAERTMRAIVLDLDKAKADPYRWVKEFAEADPGRPVIGMSEKTLKEMAPRMARYGGRAVLRKPIDPQQVVADIQRALQPPAPKRAARRAGAPKPVTKAVKKPVKKPAKKAAAPRKTAARKSVSAKRKVASTRKKK